MTNHTDRAAAASSRLARRINSQSIDSNRLALIDKILDESSSILLNDGTRRPSAREALDNHAELLNLIQKLQDIELDCNPRLPTRDEQSCSRFFEWIDKELGSNAGLKISERVSIKQIDMCHEEFALFSQSSFQKGQGILSIPRKIMLSTETAAADIGLNEFIKKDSIASTMQNIVLALHVLNERCKGEKSKWDPYLSILPNKILPVLTLNREKLECLLPSAHIFEVLKMIRAIARQYAYFFTQLQGTNLPLSRNFTYQFYCWGVSIVCSRQNEIPPENKRTGSLPTHALIPILDMCNHDVRSNQATFEGNESRLLASEDLSVGQEITINYGCRSSGDFYIHNGFVPDNLPYDNLPLLVTLNPDDKLFALKAKLLKILNMPTFGKFRLNYNNFENRHKKDPHLTMFLIVYSLSSGELEYIMDDDNTVGVADEIYEFVQYQSVQEETNEIGDPSKDNQNTPLTSIPQTEQESQIQVQEMKRRLLNSVRGYLSKRAAITVALIDRVLTGKENVLDANIIKLLKHEKSIYQSYSIIK